MSTLISATRLVVNARKMALKVRMRIAGLMVCIKFREGDDVFKKGPPRYDKNLEINH